MRIAILFITLACSCGLYAQDLAEFPARIKNGKNKDHVRIPGSRFKMVPPNGFKVVNGLIGLKKDDQSSIRILENMNVSYYEKLSSFYAGVENDGATIVDSKNIKLGKYDGKILQVNMRQVSHSYILFFGDATFCSTILSISPLADTLLSREIITSFKTVCYEKDLTFDPFEVANFEVHDSSSIFKFSAYKTGSFIYTKNGKSADSLYEEEPTLLISMMTKEISPSPLAICMLEEKKMEGMGFKIYNVKNREYDHLKNDGTHEVEIYAYKNSVKYLIYLYVLVMDKTAVIINAVIGADHENLLKEARKIAWSVTFKK